MRRLKYLPTDDLVSEALPRARAFDSAENLGPLIERIASRRIVMLGEASHGTHEFYDWRARITQELVENHGFKIIAVEGDWPPCEHLNCFIRTGEGGSARAALEHFHRWPTWMWANQEILELAEHLRRYNATVPAAERVGFHGLDVYSLFESIDSVLEKLERINPLLARRARSRYSCFGQFHRDERRYARSLVDYPEGCEAQVIQTLQDLLRFRIDGTQDRQELLFDAQQNARIVRNAEDYYRTMVLGTEDSWNVRDRHMMETLEILLERYGADSKMIVWEHNTHIGDYRATDMTDFGQINLGGLARERFGEENVALVGFGTHRGSVIASHSWGGPVQRLEVPPARAGSYEDGFHQVCLQSGLPRFYLDLADIEARSPLAEVRGHRAIGVVYDPEHERYGNYVPTSLARRYDAFLFIEETRALEPLTVTLDRGELPETWPAGQ